MVIRSFIPPPLPSLGFKKFLSRLEIVSTHSESQVSVGGIEDAFGDRFNPLNTKLSRQETDSYSRRQYHKGS